MKSNNVVPLSPHTAATHSERSSGTQSIKVRVIAHIQASTKHYIQKHLATVFNEVDDYLFDQSGRLMEGVSAQALLDNMLMLRKNRDQFAQALQSEIEKQLSHLNHHQATQTTHRQLIQAEDLALIDKAQLEKSVCINTIIHRANESNTPALLEISSALCLLFNQHNVNDEVNPLGPYFLCHSFLKICEQHDIELPVYLILFKHFERLFTNNLSELYADVISLFDSNHLISRKSQQNLSGHKNAHAITNNTVTSHTAPSGNTYSQHESETIKLANSINLLNLLNLLANSSANLGQPYLPINQLKPSLANLTGVLTQQQLIEHIHIHAATALQYRSVKNIIPQLIQSVFEQTKQDIAQPEEDRLNLASMFFDFILNDENQPESIRSLIAQLQLPILTLALKDKSFFQSSDHPARQLVNLIAKAGFGLADSNEQQSIRVFAKLKEIVQKIKDCNDVTTDIFEQHKNTLSEFLARDEHRIKLLEKRFEQAEKGKAQLEHDSKAVAKKIKKIQQANPSIGAPIKAFLSNEWKKVMLQTLLKCGQNSSQWQEQCHTLDAFIILCQKCTGDVEIKTLEDSFNTVKSQILSGLEEAGITSNAKDLIFMNVALFKSAVSLCQFNDDPPETGSTNNDYNPPKTQTELNIQNKQEPEPDGLSNSVSEGLESATTAHAKAYIDKAKALVVGQWFELTDSQNSEQSKRVKLVVRLDIVDRYVFMDAAGKKAGEFSQINMATLLESGQMKALDSAPVMERAVIDISSKIKQAS